MEEDLEWINDPHFLSILLLQKFHVKHVFKKKMFESQSLHMKRTERVYFLILPFQHPIPRGNELHLQ
jgi:hypothetical protein